MGLKKEEVIMEYYLAKNTLRTTCLKKCIEVQADQSILTDKETTCLQNCAGKMKDYLGIIAQSYKHDYR